MTEITDLSTTDSSNTAVTGESIDGAIANMGRMDNTLQAILGLLARSIRTNVLRFLDNTDATKKVKLDLSGLPTATERTWTAPYYSGTLGLVSDIIGYSRGLTLANNSTDPANDVDIGAGSAVDTTGSVSILLASGLVKRIDAAWAVGSGNGGLDTGAVTNARYYIWLIRRPDTGVVDALFSLSNTAPTMPANYTQRALIGSLNRQAGNNNALYLPNEGPWTPSLGGTATYTDQSGRYFKDGNNVFFWGHIAVSSIGTGSTSVISGLPFGSLNISFPRGGLNVSYWANAGASFAYVSGIVNQNATSITMSGNLAGSSTLSTPVNFFTNNTEVYFSGSYTATV
jgi:hypothetical protein